VNTKRQDYINIGNTRADLKDGSNKSDTSRSSVRGKSSRRYRDDYRRQRHGGFDDPRLLQTPRIEKQTMRGATIGGGYDVMLDVFPGCVCFMASCLMPNEISRRQKVARHRLPNGLEGTPQGHHHGGSSCPTTTMPQNLRERLHRLFASGIPYKGNDDFRTLGTQVLSRLAKHFFPSSVLSTNK